jgi:hypothetical protein
MRLTCESVVGAWWGGGPGARGPPPHQVHAADPSAGQDHRAKASPTPVPASLR